MPDTYSQIYIQIVFAVKGRRCLIDPRWEAELYKYITGVVENRGQKMLAVNGMPDHIHILIGMKPSCCLSDLVRECKKASNAFIRSRQYTEIPFYWQEGFGAFSYGRSQLDTVIRYIQNQKKHHREKSFREEYIKFLENFEIDYKSQYLPEFYE